MLPGGGVITGGGALLPGTVELAEKILEMPVRLGLPRDIGGLCDTVQSPIYTTAVGLVMYAAKQHLGLRDAEKTATLRGGLQRLCCDMAWTLGACYGWLGIRLRS